MTRFYLSAIITVLIASSHAIFAKVSAEGGGSYRPPAPKATPAPAPRPAAPVIRAEGGGGYVPAAPPKVTPPPATATATPQTPAPNPSRPVIRAEGGGGYVPVAPPKVTPPTTPAPTPSRPTARAEGGGGYVPPTPPVPKLTPAQERTKFEIERYAKNNGYTPEQTAALVYRSMTPEKQRNADAAAAAAAREKLTGMTAAQEKTKFEIERYAKNNGYTPEQTAALVYRSMTTTKQREADAIKAKEDAARKTQAMDAKMARIDAAEEAAWLKSRQNAPIPSSNVPKTDPLAGKSQAEIQAWAKLHGLSIQETKDLMKENPIIRKDPLFGKTTAEVQAWAKTLGLSMQEVRDMQNEYKGGSPANPLKGMTEAQIIAYQKTHKLNNTELTLLMTDLKKNAPIVIGTLGLTDTDKTSYVNAICSPTDPNCKNGGSINAYGNNGNTKNGSCLATGRGGICTKYEQIPATGGGNDFLTDKGAMDIYQKFIDGAKVDPRTGKVTLPEKVCIRRVGILCVDYQHLNEDIKKPGLNLFSSKDNQTYDSVQDLMNQAVDQACGPNKTTCNGSNQTAYVAGHSAGGVTGTLTAIALNNANFNVTNMSGYEMVINNGQYNVLHDMGVNLTNYSATTTVTSRPPNSLGPVKTEVKSTAGSGIAFFEGAVDSLLALKVSPGRPDYYTAYVPRTDFSGSLDATGGHATENTAVINTIKTALESPTPVQPAPNVGTPAARTCPAGQVRVGDMRYGSCVNKASGPTATGTPRPAITPTTIPIVRKVQVITSAEAGRYATHTDYVPPATATPGPPTP